jgi:hypothetical protein
MSGRFKGLRASEEFAETRNLRASGRSELLPKPTTDAPGGTNEWSDAHGAILRDENAIPRAHPELDGVLS